MEFVVEVWDSNIQFSCFIDSFSNFLFLRLISYAITLYYLYLAHFEVIGMCRSSYSLRLAKLHITWSDLISRMIKDSHHSVSILIRKVILSISHQYVITSIFSRKPLCILIYIKIYSTSHFDVKLRCKEDVHLYRSFIRADGSIIKNSFLWSDHIVNFIPRINQLGG